MTSTYHDKYGNISDDFSQERNISVALTLRQSTQCELLVPRSRPSPAKPFALKTGMRLNAASTASWIQVY